jgi:hypothetical protein
LNKVLQKNTPPLDPVYCRGDEITDSNGRSSAESLKKELPGNFNPSKIYRLGDMSKGRIAAKLCDLPVYGQKASNSRKHCQAGLAGFALIDGFSYCCFLRSFHEF